jgi:hypothetical protein
VAAQDVQIAGPAMSRWHNTNKEIYMKAEYFFYTLNKTERNEFIRFFTNLMKTEDYTSIALTPMEHWLHLHRYKMSVRLSNLLNGKENRRRLPKYAELITEERFMMLRGAGIKMWSEFKSLRDALIDERSSEYPKEDEAGKNTREDDLGEGLLPGS